MTAQKPLSAPVLIVGGHTLETVTDALALIDSLPTARQQTDLWQTTRQWLNDAKTAEDILHATAQLKRALDREGLLK